MARVGPGGGLGSLRVKSEPFFIHSAALHCPGGIFIYFFVCLLIYAIIIVFRHTSHPVKCKALGYWRSSLVGFDSQKMEISTQGLSLFLLAL